MHRVRQSVPYLKNYGWNPIVVCVDEKYVEGAKDERLLSSLPANLSIIKIKAFSSIWTRKIGLGALALRSLFFYFFAVNKLIKSKKIDLIYFSTTCFPVLILGNFWRWYYKIPYVIDMQDPWYSTYYIDKPKNERPKKYWFSYYLNKFLEPIAMKSCSGLISVSDSYIKQLHERYPDLRTKVNATITFGAFDKDIEIAKNLDLSKVLLLNPEHKYILYVGRGGYDMHQALSLFFGAFKKGLETNYRVYNNFRVLFVGTSYAPNGKGKKTIEHVAVKVGIENYVTEFTDRVPYYEGLSLLQKATILFIPGSDDPAYTASKLYPYILTKKPIIGIFHKQSSAKKILEETKSGLVHTLEDSELDVLNSLNTLLCAINENCYSNNTDWEQFYKYSAEEMTKKQVSLFNSVTSNG